MGQLAFAIAGGIIGSLFGMPQLGFLAGSLLGAVAFGSSGSRGGPKLTDTHVTSSTYGKPIQWGWGTARIGGNIIQAGLLQQHAHHQGKGGMGGGGSTYTYSSTHAVALCSTEFTGPIKNVLKIWADSKLVYDGTGQSGISNNIPGSGGGKGGSHGLLSTVINGSITRAFNKLGNFRVYYGTQDQLPDPALEALLTDPTDQVPYRGMAYVVMDDIDVENYGNRVPNWTFEVTFANDAQQYTQQSFKFTFDTTKVTTPSSAGVALDSFRQRAYFFNVGSGGGAGPGVHVMSLTTGNEVFSTPAATMFSTVIGGGDISFADEAPIVGNDGYLYFWGGGGNYGLIVKVDPTTMLVVGEVGTPDPFVPLNGAVPLYHNVIPITLNHGNYLLTSGLFGAVYMTDVDGLKAAGSFTFTEPTFRLVGGNMTGSGTATAFAIGSVSSFGGGDTNPFTLYEVGIAPGSPGSSAVRTYSPSDIDADWTTFSGIGDPIFDATDGNVLVWCSNQFASLPAGHYLAYLVKLNTQSGAIMWKMGYDMNVYGAVPSNFVNQTIITTGIYAFIDSEPGHNQHNVWTVNTQTGEFVISAWGQHLSAQYQVWVDALGAIMFFGTYDPNGTCWQVLITNQVGTGKALSTIVSDICHAVGFVDADLDVTQLTDDVQGFVLDSQMLARDALAPLGVAFLFDGVESDYTLKFIKRGGASIATIPSTDLAYIDQKLHQIVQETRTQEVDLPNNITLNFLDPNHDYQTATQYARRPAKPYPTMFSKATVSENVPLVAQPGFMKQLAEKLLYTAWVERVAYKTHLPWTYLPYDPTDILTLTLTDGTQIVVRMANVNIGADMTMEWSSVSESPPTYSSTATTLGGQGFKQEQLTLKTPSRLFLLDMPLLRDIDDAGQAFSPLYDAAGGWGPTWAGATIGKSADDTTFTDQTPIPSTSGAIWGSAANKLGDTTNPWTVDHINTLTVNMVSLSGTTLASATLLSVCNGANVGALLNLATGNVEVIQWMNVTTNADGSFTLSNLLRGRRGTEVYTGSHAVGDIFVVLDPNHVSMIKMSQGDINVPRFFRAVTAGTLVEDTPTQQFTDTGRAWKPYAPAQQAAVLDLSGNIQINWIRRTRVGGELMDFTGDVPVSEQAESYEVDIYNAAGNTVLRTLSVMYPNSPAPSPGVVYNAADIALDFGSTPTTLKVVVYQISTVVGRGFGKLTTLTVN